MELFVAKGESIYDALAQLKSLESLKIIHLYDIEFEALSAFIAKFPQLKSFTTHTKHDLTTLEVEFPNVNFINMRR